MLRRMCRAKIHRAKVTHSCVDYEGSIEIDEALMEAAGILENEMVLVANVTNGHRFETYCIRGKRNSGVVGLNGAAAHLGKIGDLLIILSVAWLEDSKAKKLSPRFVLINDKNQVITVKKGVQRGR